MTRFEPRLAWTTPSGAAAPDRTPLLSRGGVREALWGLGLSVLIHAGLVAGLGSIMLATRVDMQPVVLEVAVVAAAEAPPMPTPNSAEPAPPAEPARVQSPPPPEPTPSPPALKPPDAAPPDVAPPGAPPADTASQPAAAAAKPQQPTPREPPPRPPQVAAKPPALPSGHGIDGITNATPTELSASATFKPVLAPPLRYPPIAVQLGEEGTVGLLVEIDAAGTPKEVTVQKSSGFGSLDEEAVRTMLQWRFSRPLKPAREGLTTIYIPMVFKLRHHGD